MAFAAAKSRQGITSDLSRRTILSVVERSKTDIHADPAAPALGIHPQVLALGMVAAIWFIFTMTSGFVTSVREYGLVFGVVLAAVYFALTLGLGGRAARDPRWAEPRRDLHEFAKGNVAINTEVVTGREAMVQILLLPVVLAIGASVIVIVYWIVS